MLYDPSVDEKDRPKWRFTKRPHDGWECTCMMKEHRAYAWRCRKTKMFKNLEGGEEDTWEQGSLSQRNPQSAWKESEYLCSTAVNNYI